MRIIAYEIIPDNNGLEIRESTGEICRSKKLDTLLSFLLEPYGECIKVCWNLDETVASLLKLLGESNCRVLYKTKRLKIPPFSVFYIEGKVLSIGHIPSRTKLDLYGIDQYFPDLGEPESLEELEDLGTFLIQELRKMGLKPTKLTSPVAIYEECVLRHLSLPIVADMPKEAATMAYECAGRLWISAFQLGYFE